MTFGRVSVAGHLRAFDPIFSSSFPVNFRAKNSRTRRVAWAWLAACFVLGISGRASAGVRQIPRAVDGEGLSVGTKAKFHGGVALPIGVDSNVFNEDRDEGTRAALYTYPTAWASIGSREVVGGVLQTPAERTERVFDYNVAAIGGYRQFITTNERVRSQPKVSVGSVVRLAFLPGRSFEIRLDEDFFRGANPGNFESIGTEFNFNRIEHDGSLRFIGRPGGGRLALMLGYRNSLLRFEDSNLGRGNSMRNGLMHETKWRFFPRSALVFNYTFDWNLYTDCCSEIGAGRNEDSFTHRLQAGFRGQMGKRFVVSALAGWGFGYYRDDPNGPNFNSFIADAGVSYFPTLRTQLSLVGFRRFQDSLFGNFYVDNGVSANAQHEFPWRMRVNAGAGFIDRSFRGLSEPGFETTRIVAYRGAGADDLRADGSLVTLLAGVDQPIGRLFAVGMSYTLLIDAVDFSVEYANGSVDEVGYLKHMAWVFGALRI